ncbi:hypothetical protein Ddye_003127 [Dipteronia dyeriana]|uniref:Uncharacterized protein n=1 Tax=Dipteronia dyeriana TaxID=168575 RepID=A0AAD9XT01_9ROSI|nr:hypothetical protein Ddye_003127 [Dipteronia dyeriana]
MLRFALLLVVLLFIVVTNIISLPLSSPPSPSPPPPAPNRMDHYRFVQSWPPGYCFKKPCKKPAMITEQFIIHGLWPVNKAGRSLKGDPKAASVDIKDIQSDPALYNAMNKNWPSLNFDNFFFWSYEWKKHGSADPAFNNKPLPYFETTITVKNLQGGDLLTSLMNNKIKPGISTSKNKTRMPWNQALGYKEVLY